jgi:hypothetical protein
MERRAEDEVFNALKNAFPSQEAKIYREYGFDITNGVRRWVDILVDHKDWGTHVIEGGA